MFREFLDIKASHTNLTVPELMDADKSATRVLLQVTQMPTTTMEKTKEPSTIHGAPSVSDGSGDDEGNIEAQKSHGGGLSIEEAEEEGIEEGETPLVTAAVHEVEEEVCDVEMWASVALIAKAVDAKQVNLEQLSFDHT